MEKSHANLTYEPTEMASETASQQAQLSPDAKNVPGYDESLTWTANEARNAVRKVDLCIMPFIVLLFCFLQFDRTNIANALTDTLRADVHINNYHINLAQTLFIVGFIITEIPFNVVSKYFGPERFLPVTMFLWGCATWSQVFMTSPTGLYVCRFFVGALEGGYIPGMALYISKFYTLEEMGLRYAFFWASNSIAGALSGPLAVGLLSLRGRSGLAGWQWLFLIGISGRSKQFDEGRANVSQRVF
jgi:MFS family permease